MAFEDRHNWLLRAKYVGVPGEEKHEATRLKDVRRGPVEDPKIPRAAAMPVDPIESMLADLRPQLEYLNEQTESALARLK